MKSQNIHQNTTRKNSLKNCDKYKDIVLKHFKKAKKWALKTKFAELVLFLTLCIINGGFGNPDCG